MIKIKENTVLDFTVNVENFVGTTDKINFVVEGTHFDVSLPVSYSMESGKACVSIPTGLASIMEAHEVDVRLEMILDGAYYVPLKEHVEIIAAPTASVSNQVAEKTVVTASLSPTAEIIQEETQIEEVKEDAFSVEFFNMLSTLVPQK